jgi:diguanylate cyclase (GGDEF)-like protein/putative nucleotidyltransferase with HDIG domain
MRIRRSESYKGLIMSEVINRRTKVVTISRGDTVKQAAALMLSHNVSCLIVNDDRGKFIGLVTERDIAHHVAAHPDSGSRIHVKQIMTDHVVSCPPGIATNEARRIMTLHRIRHLPIVDNGVVVGILSARDIMDRQLLEDRAAAEEVAMLSKCLKSIDLTEAAEIVATEVPKMFKARNSVLCLYPGGDRSREPELVSSSRCPCLAGHLNTPVDAEYTCNEEQYYSKEIPGECRSLGGEPPRLVLPLDIVGLPEVPGGQEKRLGGYLCMCGLASSCAANSELTSYKAKLAREIVVAHLSNATRYQQARLTSLTDALTGVGSRKLLEDKLQEECDRARRYKRPFSVAIIDLDHFKMINDVLGHATGDDAMRRITECMKREKRGPDVLARYGGDEFVILLPETKAVDATVLLERIRAKVHQIGVDQDIALSISCGVAERLPDSDDTASEIMRRADLALYEAKNAGRNCVKLWDKDMVRLLTGSELEIEKIKHLQRRIIGLSEKAEKLFMESIWGLVQALEAKDPYARKHSENVVAYSVGIARTMGLGPKHLDLIERAAMIHDIGKIGIPDEILLKPDHLTAHERSVIEQHPVIAVRILEKMSFLEKEIAIVRHHHERWKGQGYPDGLARTTIPQGARILAVADTFDALTASRAYHTSRSVTEALHILEDSAGYEFDPTVVAAMATWVESVAGGLGRSLDHLTADDLRATYHPENRLLEAAAAFAPEPVVST